MAVAPRLDTRAITIAQVALAAAILLGVGLSTTNDNPSAGSRATTPAQLTQGVGVAVGSGSRAFASAAPTTAVQTDAGDALLCGAYAAVHAKMLVPHSARGDLWVVNRYRLAVAQFPDASADVRAAIGADVDDLAKQIASYPEPPPFEEPPVWHVQESSTAVERVNQACRFPR